VQAVRREARAQHRPRDDERDERERLSLPPSLYLVLWCRHLYEPGSHRLGANAEVCHVVPA
jgi:hypothetical protein